MSEGSDTANGALWRFALMFYGRPGVSSACLDLQDRARVDVVQLITLVYGDWIGRPLGLQDVQNLRERTDAWRTQAVVPLRQVRRFLKAPLPGFEPTKEALRAAVKAVELGAEQLQLALCEHWLCETVPQSGLPLPQGLRALIRLSPEIGQSDQTFEAAIETLVAAALTLPATPNDVVERHGSHGEP